MHALVAMHVTSPGHESWPIWVLVGVAIVVMLIVRFLRIYNRNK